MKSQHIRKKNRGEPINVVASQVGVTLPARRLTDITPSSRKISVSHDAPKSPKIHELIERSEFH